MPTHSVCVLKLTINVSSCVWIIFIATSSSQWNERKTIKRFCSINTQTYCGNLRSKLSSKCSLYNGWQFRWHSYGIKSRKYGKTTSKIYDNLTCFDHTLFFVFITMCGDFFVVTRFNYSIFRADDHMKCCCFDDDDVEHSTYACEHFSLAIISFCFQQATLLRTILSDSKLSTLLEIDLLLLTILTQSLRKSHKLFNWSSVNLTARRRFLNEQI